MYSRIVHHYNLILATFSRKLLSGAKLVIFLHIYKEKGRKFFDNLHFVKSGVKFPAGFGTTIGHLWAFGGLSIPHLYNNAAKIFGAEGVLRRRLENLEGKMVYITRVKCSIYRASHVSVFFEKKFSRAEGCAESCAEECAKSQLFFNVCCSAKPFVVRRYFSKIQ